MATDDPKKSVSRLASLIADFCNKICQLRTIRCPFYNHLGNVSPIMPRRATQHTAPPTTPGRARRPANSRIGSPHVLFERRFGGKAMQEHREPPGHTYGAPHATQRHLRVAIEVMGSTRAVSLDQRSGQIKHVRDRKVKALCPGRGDDVRGVAGQEQPAVPHRLGDEAVQGGNGFLD